MTEAPDADVARRLGALADRIEAEMRRVDAWRHDPPTEDAVLAGGAFGLDAGPFDHWVQVVLVRRLRQVAAGETDPPTASMVGTMASREWDGDPDREELISLILDVDAVIAGRER